MDKEISAKEFWTKEEAERYDKSSSIRKIQIEMTNRIAEEIGTEGKILDIGCGTGFSLEVLDNISEARKYDISAEQKFKNDISELAKYKLQKEPSEHIFKNKNVFGLDISESMLKTAKQKGFKKLIRGDFKFLPFKDKTFDRIVSISTIQWTTGRTPEEVVGQYKQFCLEMKRVLNENGKAGLQFYPATQKEEEVLRKMLGKLFNGYIIEEGEGKKKKRYFILENK